jgi:hypothetical protein
MVVAGVEMKAVSSSGRWGLWDPSDAMAYRHEVCHAWVYNKDNNKDFPDIPEWHITKIGHESS